MTGILPSIESLPLVPTTNDDHQGGDDVGESPMSSVHSDESVISFRRDSTGNNNNNGTAQPNGGHLLNLSMASAEPTVTLTVQLEGVCFCVDVVVCVVCVPCSLTPSIHLSPSL